ncbi:MAG TPA: hypothetical protein VLO30_07040, partial [Chthoniobacterales bacterium]|nr:hypothetical protein [Chthoniobacterales bacterium]
MKRLMTRARGSGSRILKRSSHIRIILTDEIEIKTRDKKKGGKKPGAKKSGAKKGESKRVTKTEKAEKAEKSEVAAETKSETKE